MQLLKGGDRYCEVMIFDTQLKPLVALPESPGEPASSLRPLVARFLQTGDVVMTDLHQDVPNGLIHIDVVFPIFREPADKSTGQTPREKDSLLAIGLLKLDARQFLYPLIQTWPTPSSTAETLLVRREGDEVLYLNDLRHRPNTAMNLRLPLDSPELPAARFLRGETNAIEGIDYRGVPVVAVGRTVPGTSWAIIAKVDRAEIYAPLRRQTLVTALYLGTLLLASASLFGFLWHQRGNEFLRRELASERERLAQAERAAYLMRNANDCIFLSDMDAQVIEANEAAAATYGFSLEEFKGMNLKELRPPEAQGEFSRNYARLQAEGHLVLETVHRRKDGTALPVEVSGRISDTGGAPMVISIVRDITERKAHERDIERLTRLYAALSQVNQTIVRVRSRDDLFREVCRVLVEFGGFQMAWVGLVDPTTQRVVPIAQHGDTQGYLQEIEVYADDRPEGRGPVGTAIREQKPCIFSDVVEDAQFAPWHMAAVRSGWRSVASFPVRQEGAVFGALTVYSQEPHHFGAKEEALLVEAAMDISFGLDALLNNLRREKAEEELHLLNAELEQRIRQRTAELETKNRELEAFSYSVSHDLKAPLRAISGFALTLREDYGETMDSAGREFVERIILAAERMNQLIEDLLSYSRLEIQAVQCSLVDVRELVAQVVEDYREQIEAAKTQIKTDIQCGPLRTDRAGLEQALRNLIGNAIKFSAKTAVPLVEILCRDTTNSCILEVRDNGIGFDMQYQEKIFQIFQRLRPPSEYPGTGIGLAIVRKAVQRVGGAVRAESEPGKGAMFHLEIPRA